MDTEGRTLSHAFLEQASSHLADDFLPKIRKCLDLLDEESTWWRGSESENSVGNLLLHLSGNVRQWIISGLGGAPDRRVRSGEFSARREVGKEEAYEKLEETVSEAVSVLRTLSPSLLLQQRTIQGFTLSGLQAVFHVVEHFSYHTGQIVFITKLRTGRDLRFYNL